MHSQKTGAKGPLDNQRKLERALCYLNAFDQASGILIGHVDDIHHEGLNLTSKIEIELFKEFPIWAEIPIYENIISRFPLVIKGVWNKEHTSPDHFRTGCRIIEPGPEAINAIDKIILFSESKSVLKKTWERTR